MSKINYNYVVIGGIGLIALYMITQTQKQLYKETLDKAEKWKEETDQQPTSKPLNGMGPGKIGLA